MLGSNHISNLNAEVKYLMPGLNNIQLYARWTREHNEKYRYPNFVELWASEIQVAFVQMQGKQHWENVVNGEQKWNFHHHISKYLHIPTDFNFNPLQYEDLQFQALYCSKLNHTYMITLTGHLPVQWVSSTWQQNLLYVLYITTCISWIIWLTYTQH